jgi:hypothetical protein
LHDYVWLFSFVFGEAFFERYTFGITDRTTTPLHIYPFKYHPLRTPPGMCCYCMCCRRAAGKKALKAKSFGEFLNT